MTLELQQEKIKQYSNYYPDTCTCPRLLKYSNVYYLRLLIDDNFYWNTHINNIIVKLRQLTYFFLTAKTNTQLTNNLNNLFWNGTVRNYRFRRLQHSTLIVSLAVAQKNVIKIILGKQKTYPSVELFKLLRVLNI